MARKTYTGMMQFKKYREQHKAWERFWKKAARKNASDRRKIERQQESARKKRKAAWKKEKEKARAAREKAADARKDAPNPLPETEPFSLSDLWVVLGIAALVIIGFAAGLWAAILTAAAAFVAAVGWEMWKDARQTADEPALTDAEAEMLFQQLHRIEVDLETANNGTNPEEVRSALDSLLRSIDVIMAYDEEDLRNIGMSKERLPEQRELLLRHYDEMIRQATEVIAEANGAAEQNIQPEQQKLPEQTPEEKAVPAAMCEQAVVETEDGIPTLQQRLKAAVPTERGLYPHEILMLHYASGYKTAGNTFQQFWKYQYSVTEPQKVLNSLFERGFIAEGDLRSALERLKVTELRAELKEVGCSAAGKKAELIDRLLQTAATQQLERKYPERSYALTEKGRKELEDNPYVFYLHRTRYMSVWDMNYLLHHDNPSRLGYRDILWREWNLESGRSFAAKEYGLYRNTRLDMARLLLEEGRHKGALRFLCEVAACDLSDLNPEIPEEDRMMRRFRLGRILEDGFPYSESAYRIAPGVLGWLETVQQELGLKEDAFRKELLTCLADIFPHSCLFTEEECADIILYEIGEHPRKLAAVYRQAQARLRAELEALQ